MSLDLEEVIGYHFRNPALSREALTHKSYAYEKGELAHNERLEFLGDSVLAALVAHLLFAEHPEEDEGRLSKRKAALVSRSSLAAWAERLGLGRHMLLGTGEESTGGRTRPSILANALEALLGAVYLDGGFAAARDMLQRCCLDSGAEFVETDFKSRLQELVQKKHKVTPEYKLVETSGPDHDKSFSVEVTLGSRTLGEGDGKTKKEAEQAAASDALNRLQRPRES
ncbi:MAG: ribonuclease III [Elusimicrobia bacterium GWA2_69_24]|nr:MAG: ribonuclease III [Elusimicrobia bacterium GWA2_69_24]HBL16829.1 ribonuclease III [Elusimicrobiota bacterium]